MDGVPSALEVNPKLDLLMELLDETLPQGKVLVVNEFVYSGDIIAEALRKRKIKFARLYGGTKDKAGELRKFTSDKSCKVFVMNSQSGGRGINLQMAHQLVVYEASPSYRTYQQVIGRCHRQGQTEKTFIFDLVARHTVEERIQAFLREGLDIVTSLLQPGGMELLRPTRRIVL